METLTFMKNQKLDLALLLWNLTNLSELVDNSVASFELTALLVSDELSSILESLHLRPRKHNQGIKRSAGRETIEDFAFSVVRKHLETEIYSLNPVMKLPAQSVTPDELLSVDMKSLITQTKRLAPRLWDLILNAAYTQEQRLRNTNKNPEPTVLYIICIALYTRSPQNAKLIKLISFYLMSCGLAAKAFDTLHAFGIAFSQKWAYNTVAQVSAHALASMRRDIKRNVFHISHDNLNIAFRVQEQRKNNQSHFDSGTAATIYLVSDKSILRPNNSRLQETRRAGHQNPIMALDILDLNCKAAPQLRNLIIHHILRILTSTAEFEFDSYSRKTDAIFDRPVSRQQLLCGRENRTVQYRLETIHQEESTLEGNDRILQYYLGALGLGSPLEQQKLGLEGVLTWSGDLLTQLRLQALQRMRMAENNSFERLDWLVPLFGFFHLMMAFAKSLHSQYYGTFSGLGLAHAFQLMGRKGLGKPSTKGNFHHTLEEALYHILYAHLRDIWKQVSGVSNLSELCTQTPADLRTLAEHIYEEYCTSSALHKLQSQSARKRDHVYEQTVMWSRDMLDYVVLNDAISQGDVATMEDMLPRLVFRFAGGKNHNYAAQTIELLQGLNREWPDDVKCVRPLI